MGLLVCDQFKIYRNLKRVFVEEIPATNSDLVITGKAFRHLGVVLRSKINENVLVLDRFGRRALTKVENISRTEIKLKIMEIYETKVKNNLNITVLQAILKGNSTDYLIQRLSELGVNRLLFFRAKRSLWRFDQERSRERLMHWDGVAIRSYLQSDRNMPIKIVGPFNGIETALEFLGNEIDLRVLCHERAEIHNFKALIEPLREAQRTIGVAIAVGPEGGFEDQEVHSLKEAGFIPIRLGPRIFMAESASIVFSTIIQYELGDLG